MAVVVYRYGTPHWAEIPAEVDEQLRLAHSLREDLVTLEHARQEATAAVWSAYPRVAELEETIAAGELEAEELGRAAAKERSAQRGRGRTASSARLTEVRRGVREAKAARRAEISRVREESADELQGISDGYRAAVKAKYAEYCQVGELREETVVDEDGDAFTERVRRRLYWATFNDVSDHHRTAVKRVQEARALGRPANLRHHRFDGSGAVAVQLQRQAGVPPRLPATVADGSAKWRNVLHLSPWVDPDEWGALPRAEQRRRRLGAARFAMGGGRVVEVPVIVHRMLPPDADITGARLVVRRIGGHRRVEVHVTARVPDPQPAASGVVAVLHLGWRRDGDVVRVGTWRTTEQVTVPAELRDVVVADSECTGRLLLPSRVGRRFAAHDAIRSDRDTALDKVRASLAGWLHDHGAVTRDGAPDVTEAVVRRWRAPGRFARLALDWRDDPPEQGEDMAAELEAWRVADRHLWEPEAHGRDGAVAARDDAYRRAAAWLAGACGVLVVDDTVLSEVARRPDPGREPELPTVVVDRAARQRTMAAPGRLRQLMVVAAERRGVQVVTVPHTGITRTHYRCGHVNPADGRYAVSRVVVCDGCGDSYDQDASATLVMLAASGVVADQSTGAARSTT